MSEIKSLAVLGTAVCCPDAELTDSLKLDGQPIDQSLLPANIRRRTSLTTRMAVTAAILACRNAGVDPEIVSSIFASVGGEIQVTDALCLMLPDADAILSPTQFHNSVHNTTAGYWSIISGSRKPTTALAGGYDTFAMGLLETWSQAQFLSEPILLVCYDETWPQYLAPPIGRVAFASALIFGTEKNGPEPLARIDIPRRSSSVSSLDDELNQLIRKAPAAAAIPLLQAIHNGDTHAEVALNIGGEIWTTRCLEEPAKGSGTAIGL